MIDINLTERAEIQPEKPAPKKRKPPDKKLMIVLSAAAVVVLLFYVFGDMIMGLIYPSAQDIENRYKPDSTAVAQQPVVTQVDSTPVQREEPPPPPAWDYGRSMLHVDAYLAFTGALPEGARYSLVTVAEGGIIAELTPVSENVRTAVGNALRQFAFTFEPDGNILHAQGMLRPGAAMPQASPAAQYADAELNMETIGRLAENAGISIEAQDLTGPLARGALTVLPGWIKFFGKEAGIKKFLNTMREEGLSLNIVKISGSAAASAGSVNLFLQYELIL